MSVIPPGTSVMAKVAKDAQGQMGLFTDEALLAGNTVIPKGVRLPLDFNARPGALPGINDRLIVTTALEPFALYVKVSLYAALALSLPFLLFQIWGFVSPGLYPHERSYAFPFISMSSVSFVAGAAFAYYIIFPPAAKYLLGLGQDFRLMLKADDYFDFIILVMLGMGLVFQMPAVTYVLARIGLVSAGYMIRIWKTALIVIRADAGPLCHLHLRRLDFRQGQAQDCGGKIFPANRMSGFAVYRADGSPLFDWAARQLKCSFGAS